MEHKEAFAAIQAQQNSTYISQDDVRQILANVRGTTFANIAYVTKVATAAAHKAVDIKKVTIANVQLFNNLQEYTNVYENAVKRTAEKLSASGTAISDPTAIASFESAGNWFEHTDCYSIVKHKTKEQFYLFAIYGKAESLYVIDGVIATKQEVAAYLTKSAAEALLTADGTTYNVTHDITHSVVVRVVGLENIVSIIAQKQILLV
jgi:hypothetical protein